ncbi:glycosyltransferase family 4 protein [Occallatibacter riparius]|uniref:Glycosyltransferase family 4 protein n=1 Tax=Occallatibacter riparius TaxID=1002689 RepID=A0A9J7BSI5_9BACT|nr:glycosyltransferase family 4 protein [Occallatibacter riparius]UWZ85559.1 glycosyltransferase family 4 protein [Occallatibacter riparius]
MRNRILLVSITPFFGGGEAYYLKLAKLLGDRYELGAAVSNDRLREALSSIGIRTWRLASEAGTISGLRYAKLSLQISHAIRSFSPELVHLNGQGESYLASVPQWFGLKIVSTRHTVFEPKTASFLKRTLVARNLGIIHKTVCVSDYVRQQLSEVVDGGRLVVIPNWLESVPTAPISLPRQIQGPFRLLYVGRLVRDKGILDLIQAVRLLHNVSLTVVGEGEDANRARGLAQGLPVEFCGFQSDPQRFYRQADLLVFPSHHEGQGFVPVEAMAHGLPCLLSDIPANRETADDRRAAELFRCGAPEDLAAKVSELMDSTQRLSGLSAYARDYVLRNYTRSSVEQAYFKLFEDPLAASSDAPADRVSNDKLKVR